MNRGEDRGHRAPRFRDSQAAKDLRRAWERNPWAVVLLGVVVLVVVVSAFSSVTGSEGDSYDPSSGTVDSESEASYDSPVDETSAFVQDCIDRWNQAGHIGRGAIKARMSTYQVYVSVGPSADFPDQCLVTVAENTTGRALQFTERQPGDWMPTGSSGTTADLDAQTKDWNATPNPDGTLTREGL